MPSVIPKRSVRIAGHRTSVSVEDVFWNEVRAAAREARVSIDALIEQIDARPRVGGLSSAVRMFVMQRVQSRNPAPIGDSQ